MPPFCQRVFSVRSHGWGQCPTGTQPCHLSAKPIDAEGPGHGRAFKAAAKRLGGVTGWVERAGVLRLGDSIRLHVPDQPAWPHLDAARGR